MENSTVVLKNTTMNPGPLGLIGFGLATILLNLHNSGLFGLDSAIIAMGIFVGGIAQVIVGIMEWKKSNLFGMMAFSSYGFFWLTLAFLLMLPKMGLADAPTNIAMGYYLSVWALFTIGLTVAAWKISFSMGFLFTTVVLLFVLLAIADFTGSSTIKTIAGIEGIICGLTAVYLAMAQLYEDVFGKKILPY